MNFLFFAWNYGLRCLFVGEIRLFVVFLVWFFLFYIIL